MIKLDRVTKYFSPEKIAVDNVSFEVQEGETLVLLGTSGCGKTTTLRLINRLLDPTSGNIYIHGKHIREQPLEILRRNIGYVLQNSGLFPHYTVRENIGLIPALLHWDQARIRHRIITLMDKLHLPAAYAEMYPHQLSGGQQQRVGLARALAADPPVLLMDEPFGALDPVIRVSIRQEFINLDELRNKTIILVTHDIEEAFELGDRICLMSKGRIQQLGNASALLFHPANHFVQSFLDPQRLQLELKTLQLQDLWPFLSAYDHADNLLQLPVESSCWTALEMLINDRINVVYRQTQKTLDSNTLIKAIAAYKKKLSQYGCNKNIF